MPTCVNISGGIATFDVAFVQEDGLCLEVVSARPTHRNGSALALTPSWLTYASDGENTALGEYTLTVTVSVDVIEAFVIDGVYTDVYTIRIEVQRCDCEGGSQVCSFPLRIEAPFCKTPDLAQPEQWVAFTGTREIDPGGGTHDQTGLHVFSPDDPLGTYHMIWPRYSGSGPTSTYQRFPIGRIELHEDPDTGIMWIWYVGYNPSGMTNNVNIRKVKLNGQDDTEVVEPDTGTSSQFLSVWYDPVALLYLCLYCTSAGQYKRVYEDGSDETLLITGSVPSDLAFDSDGQTFYVAGGGDVVRYATSDGAATGESTGNIGADRIQVTADYVYIRRIVSGEVRIARYDKDLASGSDLISGHNDATNASARGFAVDSDTEEIFVHQEWASGDDGFSRYELGGTLIEEEYWAAGLGAAGGPQWAAAARASDVQIPATSQVTKLYLTGPGDDDDINTAEADGTAKATVDSDNTRCADARGIAYDNAANKFYFCQESLDTIYQEDAAGGGVVSWATSQDQVFGIAIDEENGYVYFSMKGDGGKIKRADLGGTSAANITDIVTGIGTGVRHISLDVENGKIYWCDQTGGLVRRANIADGSSAETVASLSAAYTVCVEPGSGGTYFYYSAFGGQAIYRRVKDLGSAAAQLFDLSDFDDVSAATPRQMVIDPGGLWVYFVASDKIWRFFHSMSGLDGEGGLTILNGETNIAYEGIALRTS